MHNRSLSRELSLISLGLIKDKGDFKLNKFQIEEIFESALDSLINHCRDELDSCELELENASQKILDSELQEGVESSFANVREELKKSLKKIEIVMNTLSLTLDFPKLIVSSGQIDIREDVTLRISNIINNGFYYNLCEFYVVIRYVEFKRKLFFTFFEIVVYFFFKSCFFTNISWRNSLWT